MASDLSFVQFVCDQIRNAGRVSFRKMFGEYAVYCDGKVIGLICDNQFFLKPTDAGRAELGNVNEAPPYPGAKNYFLIEDQLDNARFMSDIVQLTVKTLPAVKDKKTKTARKR